MASVALLPAACLHRHMPATSFKGDSDILVDRLIVASRKKEVSDGQLIERALVPFQFDAELPLPVPKALEPRRRSKPQPIPTAITTHQPHQGLKRGAADRSGTNLSASPPKKENERLQGKHQRSSKPASPTSSGNANGRKARRDASTKSLPQLAAATASSAHTPAKRATSQPCARAAGVTPDSQATRSRAIPAKAADTPSANTTPSTMSRSAPAAPVAAVFAGPAFTNSPTPDSLPIPTSSLLFMQAADSLRVTLQL